MPIFRIELTIRFVIPWLQGVPKLHKPVEKALLLCRHPFPTGGESPNQGGEDAVAPS